MDFIPDWLAEGRCQRALNVIDDYNREDLAIVVGLTIPSARVLLSLDKVIEWRGKPSAIRCGNGSEYISKELITWAIQSRITILYIQPDKPTENAYVERFNGTARSEWQDLHMF